MRTLATAVIGVVVVLAACSDDPAPQPTYVCDQSATYAMCVEHGPLDEYGMGASRFACETQGGTWGTTPCPTANRIASCRMGAGQGGGFQYYFAGFTGDLAYLESQCTMYGGTWTRYAQ